MGSRAGWVIGHPSQEGAGGVSRAQTQVTQTELWSFVGDRSSIQLDELFVRQDL
jgi:hypothetical protein